MWIELGRAALQARLLDEAITAADAAREHARDGEQLVAIARILEAAGATARSAATWREAARRDPESFPAQARLGRLAWRAGEVSEAIRALTRAVDLRPAASEQRRLLVEALIHDGQGDQAIARFRQYADPEGVDDQLLLARAWEAKGDGLRALLALQVAERLAPDRFDVCLALCACMWRHGQPSEALVLVDRMLARWPDSVEMRINAATVRSALGEVDGALAALDEAERLRPDLLVVRQNRGAILFEAGRFGEAVELFREVVERDPEDATAHMQLAAALRFQHRPLEARHEVERALALGDAGVRAQARKLGARLTAPPVVPAELDLALSDGEAVESAMSGSLARLQITQLLEFVRTNLWSGTVLLSSRRGVAELRAENGRLLIARCSMLPGLKERLIDHGVDPSQIDAPDVGTALRPVGLALLESGAVTHDALRAMIEAQIRAVVGELLQWTHGYFMLQHLRAGQPVDPLTPAMNIEYLLLDALREADEARAGVRAP